MQEHRHRAPSQAPRWPPFLSFLYRTIIYRPPCSGSERSEASVAARGAGYQVKRARVIEVVYSGCKTIF